MRICAKINLKNEDSSLSHITLTCSNVPVLVSGYFTAVLVGGCRVIRREKAIGWSGSLCTAWLFTATHFTAHRKAFAFYSSTLVSGLSGNFDNSSTRERQGCQVAGKRRFCYHNDWVLDINWLDTWNGLVELPPDVTVTFFLAHTSHFLDQPRSFDIWT